MLDAWISSGDESVIANRIVLVYYNSPVPVPTWHIVTDR